MELKFFSIDEVKEFVKQLKGTRGGKNDADDGPANPGAATGNAPAPVMPPAGGAPGFPGGGFAPPAGGAGPGGFPAAGAPMGPDPQVLALVSRVANRIDWSMQPQPNGGGQAPENVLQWFRGQCGPEAAGYTMDQIKQVALPRLSMPALENIAKLMNA